MSVLPEPDEIDLAFYAQCEQERLACQHCVALGRTAGWMGPCSHKQVITLRQRARNYTGTFPDRPPLVVHTNQRTGKEWLYGVWEIGNNYKSKAGYYGEYPPGFLARLRTVFFEPFTTTEVLHCFAGTVPPDNPFGGVRVDIRQDMLVPTVRGDAVSLPFRNGQFKLGLYDPPYSKADAVNYGTGLPLSKLVTLEAARVIQPGGFLVWLDTSKPMYQKRLWDLCGEIGVARSTMHRVRMVFIFRRTQELVDGPAAVLDRQQAAV